MKGATHVAVAGSSREGEALREISLTDGTCFIVGCAKRPTEGWGNDMDIGDRKSVFGFGQQARTGIVRLAHTEAGR